MLEQIPSEFLSGAGGVAIGGGLTKLAGVLRSYFKAEKSLTEKLRIEMREDLQELRKEVQKLETEIDFWKEKFYLMKEENLKLRNDCDRMEREIQELKGASSSQSAR